MSRIWKSLRTIALLAVAACASGVPEAIAYGMDLCASCHMQIDDRRFGAVVLTKKGRTLKFDSIECLRTFTQASPVDVSTIWVADFSRPGLMVRADSALFINIGAGKAPMGRGWAAVSSEASAQTIGATIGIESIGVKRWSELS